MNKFLNKSNTKHILLPFSIGLAIFLSSIFSAFSFPSATAFTYNVGLIFTASPTTVSSGSASTLSWEAYYIDVIPSPEPSLTCTASGAWSGSKVVEGSQSTGALTSNKTYTLTCVSQAGTSVTKSVTVTVGGQVIPAPTASLTVNGVSSVTVPVGTNLNYAWNSTNGNSWNSKWSATGSCPDAGLTNQQWDATTASGGYTWPAHSSQAGCTYTITYTVTGTGGTASKTITVAITSATPTPTLSIIASASPTSGTAPLNDVDITGNVSGTATGSIVYRMDCTNNGTWEHTSSSITTDPYTVTNLCDYPSAGTYTVKVQATRQGITASDTATVTVGSQSNPACFYAPYDYNNNGILDSGDADLLISYLGIGNSCPVGKLCDINQNGAFTIADVTALSGLIGGNDTWCPVITPTPTLSVTASTNPTSGTAPLNDVDITGNVSGTATGSIVYRMDCTNNGTWEHTSSSITTDPYTVTNLCDYPSAGTYTVKVQATRQGVTAEDTATVTVSVPVPLPESKPNPTLGNSCGIDIALVLDSSGSVDSIELGSMKEAFKSFVNIFLPATPTFVSVTDFDSTASVVQTFTDDISVLNIAIDQPISGGATNWEDGLKKAFGTFDPRPGVLHPNLIVFASDGNPTVNNQSGATSGTTDGNDLINAILAANTIKDAGTRIIALGIGDNLNTGNLEAISGVGAVYTSNFNTLAADLREIAAELCGGTITVKKLIDQDGNLATTDDQFPASGWEFDINGDPTDPSSEFTGVDGFTQSVEVEAGTYSVTEIQEEDFNLIGARCTINNQSVGSFAGNSVTDISVGASDIVTCTFINHENHIPVITLNAPNPDNILVNDGPYIEPGFIATDLEDGDITGEVVVGGDVVDTTTPGTYFITYNVVDSLGAPAVQKTRVVNVSDLPPQCSDGLDNDGDGLIDYPEDPGCVNPEDDNENTPPVITAEAVLFLTLGSAFDPLAHATVEDAEDDPEPALVVGGDTVLTNTIGDYSVTYDATDSKGATAVQKIMIVKVRAQCSDTMDNIDAEDTLADIEDPGCHSDADPTNPDSYEPNDNDEANPADVCANLEGIQLTVPNGLVSVNGNCVPPSPVCSDALDNDEDGLIDSADPGCHTDGDPANPDTYEPNDPDETDPVDVCANINGIQVSVPEGLVQVGNNCVTPEPGVVSVDLTANPTTIDKGQNSELSWVSTNATTCSAGWTSATSTSGTQVVSPASTTIYSITCGNGTATSTDEATVTVNSPSITVTLSANPGTIDKGQNSTLSWTSGNTTTCEAPWTTATSTSGSQVVGPNDTTSYTITCGNGVATSTASATVNVETPSSGGGGRSGDRNRGAVLSASTVAPSVCFYLRDYMRRDFNNDPLEVIKLQAFLINFEGHSNLSINGVFDQATYDAVSSFQMKYFKDILEPWGHTGPTGYVYILTLKKVNEIYCQRIFPLNEAQINEIIAFRQLLESLRAQGINPELPRSSTQTTTPNPSSWLETINGVDISTTTTPTPVVPIVGTEEPDKGQNLGALAAVIFAPPANLMDAFRCLYEIILILVALYILGNVLKNVLYKDLPENTRKRFVTKWITIDLGLIVAIMASYIFEWWCLIFPLLVALLVALFWTLSYQKHNSMRASVKSWYLVITARLKSKGKEAPKKEDTKVIEKESTSKVIAMGPKK